MLIIVALLDISENTYMKIALLDISVKLHTNYSSTS